MHTHLGMKERAPHITLLHTVSRAARRPRKAPGLSLPSSVLSTREAVPRGAGTPCSGCQRLLPSGAETSSENAHVPSPIQGDYGSSGDHVSPRRI